MKKCRKPYGFCINVDLEKTKTLLKEWWNTDFDVEFFLYNNKNPIVFSDTGQMVNSILMVKEKLKDLAMNI